MGKEERERGKEGRIDIADRPTRGQGESAGGETQVRQVR